MHSKRQKTPVLPPAPTAADIGPLLAGLEPGERDKIMRVMRRDKILRCVNSASYGSTVAEVDEDRRRIAGGHYEEFVSEKFEHMSVSSAASSRRESSASSTPMPDFEVEVPDESVMRELERLDAEERAQIVEVMRKDTIVKLYTDLKVR